MSKKSEYQKMIDGELYSALNCQDLANLAEERRLMMEEYNALPRNKIEERQNLLKNTLGSIGENFHVESPFHVDYGVNIHIGDNFYANFDCIILDASIITIGDRVFFGPSVRLYGATHPIDAAVRGRGLELTAPITIGDDCWIGGSTVVLPGVTIGPRTIIGAGSVVTKDIPADVIAAGNPCQIIREINEDDRDYWHRLEEEYYQ